METNNEDVNVTDEVTNEELNNSTDEITNVNEPVEEPTDEPVEEPTDEPVEEPTDEPVEEPTDEPVEDKEPLDDFSDLDELLSNIDEEDFDNNETEEEEDEEMVVQPKFFKDDDIELSDEDLEELDKTLTELETQNNEYKTKMSEYEQEVNDLSSALDKIGEHPVLGPLATALIEGKELNIPEFLKEKVETEIDALPKEGVSNEGVKVGKKLNPLEKIAIQGQGQANFLKGF